MLVQEKKFQEEDGSIGYYEAVFESSNILQTTYFPASNLLYISFQRGGVYSYGNVSEDLYEDFKAAESHGKFFISTIKSQPEKYPYRKEFTLYPDEVKDLKEIVEKNTVTFQNGLTPSPQPVLVLEENDTEPNNIVFYIEEEETIRINEEGFYWKGEFVEDDEVIYQKFKEWIEYAHNKKQEATKMTEWVKSELKLLENTENKTQFEEGQLYELKILDQWT